jgi:hypothetical protein
VGCARFQARRPVTTFFDQLQQEQQAIIALSKRGSLDGYLGQELLRFISLGGTLKGVPGFTLDATASVDERFITHVLGRSLIESFFQLMHLYDDPTQTVARWDRYKDGFKREYGKLMSEPTMQGRSLEPAGANWNALQPALDVRSVMAQLKNAVGQKLDPLYVIYRITSFDTHGKTLTALLDDVFGKPVNFPVLDIRFALELMAEEYISMLIGVRQRLSI